MMHRAVLFLLLLVAVPGTHAAAPQSLDELLEWVRQDRSAERRHNAQREAQFLAERDRQRQLLEASKVEKAAADQRAETLRRTYEQNLGRLAELDQALRERAGNMEELFTIARQSAIDARNTLSGSRPSFLTA